jgi:hypothetical protein
MPAGYRTISAPAPFVIALLSLVAFASLIPPLFVAAISRAAGPAGGSGGGFTLLKIIDRKSGSTVVGRRD